MSYQRFKLFKWRIGLPVTVLLLASAGFGAWKSIQTCQYLINTSLDRAYLATSAYAEAVERWIAKGDQETLRYVGNLMLAGGTQSIQIIEDNRTILALPGSGNPGPSEFGEEPFEMEKLSRALLRLPDGWQHEIVVPFGESSSLHGGVRVLMNAEPDRAQIVAAVLRISLLAGISWLISSGVIILGWHALRAHRRKGYSGTERAAPLTIDTKRKKIFLFGDAITLTPKQYELMKLLVSGNGGVFAEQEILDSVWPDSPYADANDIRQCIYKIRRRLTGTMPGADACLVNEKGFGYRISVETLQPFERERDHGDQQRAGELRERRRR